MNTIEAVGYFSFAPEQHDAVMRAIERSIAIVRTKDTGTLAYDWFLDDSGSRALVREKYVSSEALMEHAANVADAFAELRQIAETRMEIHGEPSAALLSLLQEMKVPIYRPLHSA